MPTKITMQGLVRLLLDIAEDQEIEHRCVWISDTGNNVFEIGVTSAGHLLWNAKNQEILDGTPMLKMMIDEFYQENAEEAFEEETEEEESVSIEE